MDLWTNGLSPQSIVKQKFAAYRRDIFGGPSGLWAYRSGPSKALKTNQLLKGDFVGLSKPSKTSLEIMKSVSKHCGGFKSLCKPRSSL
jgi:hypothetical protein